MERTIITVVYGPDERSLDLDVASEQTVGVVASFAAKCLLHIGPVHDEADGQSMCISLPSGELLDNSKTFAEHGLWDGSTVVLRLRRAVQPDDAQPPPLSQDVAVCPPASEPVVGWRSVQEERTESAKETQSEEPSGYVWKRLDE